MPTCPGAGVGVAVGTGVGVADGTGVPFSANRLCDQRALSTVPFSGIAPTEIVYTVFAFRDDVERFPEVEVTCCEISVPPTLSVTRT
ncbi:MAG: hypothetical protein BWY81_00363 [Firmicutes bacterium ADurb.Bin467]|nr:MAG: hypothetical protein BWY81_00363 [Firmicutes bacterium ADurb.Bin467]